MWYSIIRGDVRRYTYDALGRISAYTDADGTVSYTYDKNSNVLTVTDKNGTVTRTFDELNRVKTCTDTFGKTICYFYDEVGNLKTLTYPDNTSVEYTYDENNNLLSVTDWACRRTEYAYDKNNNCTRVVKPDGSITINIYDGARRLANTTIYSVFGNIISNVEYNYDGKNRLYLETDLAKCCHMSYTYDSLSRVETRRVSDYEGNELKREDFVYDAAGNISSDGKNKFAYDANNRLMTYNCNPAGYDKDGNMLSARLSGTNTAFEYDSSNRLIKAGDHTYTYNAEDVRIRNVRDGYDTTYTYNTNARLSQLLVKTTNGITTKYVYGLGLIGEEKCDEFKTYHFDYRGSTIAITDSYGYVIDTFEYDLYGNVTNHNGYSFVIFGYNGRDGVVTDNNGLIYMRARYYSPELKRFVNADIIPGEISDSTSLNRYSYVNGNPASYVDPFGLAKEERGGNNSNYSKSSYWVDNYDAIYVSVYSLDVVGHAYVFLKDKDGTWIKTEFNTSGGDDIKEKKENAQVFVKRNYTSEQVQFILMKGMRDAYISGSYKSDIFTEGLQFIPISGDFSESIKLAEEYENTDYNGYHFTNNNCLYYVREILRAGTADDKEIEKVLNDSKMIVPKGFINELSSANK